jgi:hypothetical protein
LGRGWAVQPVSFEGPSNTPWSWMQLNSFFGSRMCYCVYPCIGSAKSCVYWLIDSQGITTIHCM